MLRLILGRAGSGKTTQALLDMRAAGGRGKKCIFIVPEQYSHDAERHMCIVCGNSASLYAEVATFSRLCTRMDPPGGGPGLLDAGGRIIVMERAVASVSSQLKAYAGRRKADFLSGLVAAYDELRSSSVSIDDLAAAAERARAPLGAKLHDMALIFAAYEALMPDGTEDPAERMERLARFLRGDPGTADTVWFIDGFTDFTEQQRRIVAGILASGADITVCLTCDGLESVEPAFAPTRRTALALLREAASHGIGSDVSVREGDARSREPELVWLERHLLDGGQERFDGECAAVELIKADTMADECGCAAGRILDLVRGGLRWRDISVVARGWEDYGRTVECVFEKYGIPFHESVKADILQKPVVAALLAVLDAINDGWDSQNMFRYLKTGLTGLSADNRDVLENYVIKWNIRGRSMWTRSAPWDMDPDGYTDSMSEAAKETAARVDAIRRAAAAPVDALDGALRAATVTADEVDALVAFVETISLGDNVQARADDLRTRGDLRGADEYVQLFDTVMGALEQLKTAAGDVPADTVEFAALLKLVFSECSIGTIPTSVDRVGIGDMTRMKRRDVKCLIVLGATDERLPTAAGGGLFSDAERDALETLGIELSDTAETRLDREMNTIYSSLTLPSQKLIVTYPSEQEARPSFVVTELSHMMGIPVREAGEEHRLRAAEPCFELAAQAVNMPWSVPAQTAKAYFSADAAGNERLCNVMSAARALRGRMSEYAAQKLYPGRLRVSASRVDTYYSCRFLYFMRYGLRARSRRPAGFNGPEAGIFMHYILEHISAEPGSLGGLSREDIRRLTEKYAQEYARTRLNGLEDKEERFRYLFRRLCRDAVDIVSDMAEELRRSDFKPIDFELKFDDGGQLPPVEVRADGESLTVNGKVDRVDGWIKGDKLYLRVVDYKTREEQFSLSDVWYGMGMQMLIYLFALQRTGSRRYGKEIVPAGVLYAPARDIFAYTEPGTSPEDIAAARAKKLVRSGLLLDDPEVIAAMEHDTEGRYIPVKLKKDGTMLGDSLASLEKFGKLAGHIDKMLAAMASEVRSGSVAADPYYKTDRDNACLFCDYFEACHFDEDTDTRRYPTRLKAPEVWARMEGGDGSGR